MKTTLRLALGLGLALGSAAALAQQAEGNWMMRVRAVDVQPVHKSSTPGVLPNDDIYVNNKLIPEVDFTYFFTKNIAAELILTYPQELTAKSKILGDLGKFDALPPTLTLQYHFAPEATFRPYVGAGVNYTAISHQSLNKAAPITISNSSTGLALQVGFDYKLGANSYLNVDIKKVNLEVDAKVAGTKIGKLTLDPLLVGVGYGFRF